MPAFIVTLRQTETVEREYFVVVQAGSSEAAAADVVARFDTTGFDHHDFPRVVASVIGPPQVVGRPTPAVRSADPRQ